MTTMISGTLARAHWRSAAAVMTAPFTVYLHQQISHRRVDDPEERSRIEPDPEHKDGERQNGSQLAAVTSFILYLALTFGGPSATFPYMRAGRRHSARHHYGRCARGEVCRKPA